MWSSTKAYHLCTRGLILDHICSLKLLEWKQKGWQMEMTACYYCTGFGQVAQPFPSEKVGLLLFKDFPQHHCKVWLLQLSCICPLLIFPSSVSAIFITASDHKHKQQQQQPFHPLWSGKSLGIYPYWSKWADGFCTSRFSKKGPFFFFARNPTECRKEIFMHPK